MALTLVNLTNTVTGTLPAANGGTGTTSFPAPGANGNALISNGTTWTSTAISTKPFATGTAMLFKQTAAPTGWTKVTTYNDYALRIVSGTAGTGGSVAFTTAFASQAASGTVGATTLSTAQIPSHTHSLTTIEYDGSDNQRTGFQFRTNQYSEFNNTRNTNSTGSGGSHDHSFTGSSINLAVQYVDMIIANID